MATAPLEIPRQAGFKPSQADRTRDCALEGQKGGRNIRIKDKDGTTKFIASLEGGQLKSRNQKSPENRLC